MMKDEVLKRFFLYLDGEKKNRAITAWKERGSHRVCVFELYDDKAEIIWQDTQRTPFWASENKRGETFKAIKKLVPDLTPERFQGISSEFANADAVGDIEDRTERSKDNKAPKETPLVVARSEMGAPIPQDSLDARAMGFLQDPALLYHVKLIIEKGLVLDRYRFVLGEDDKKLLTFLIALSASTKQPQSLWVTGTSGFGKSNLVMTSLALMPPNYVKRRAYLTAAGLRYGDQDYKVLFVQEWREKIEQDVRLTSKEDGSYIYEIAGRDPETNEMTTQVGEIPAKTIITTSAERLPSPQMLRRCWLLSIDESPELTKLVNKRKAEYAVGKIEPASQEEIAVVQRAVQLLKPADVIIPYADQLVDLAPWDRTRLDSLYDVIKAVAWVHQRQRPRDDQQRIVAMPADLYMAIRIAWPTLAQTLQQLPDRLRKVLERLPTDQNAPGKTNRDLARELSISQSSVRVYLSDLTNLGHAIGEQMSGTRAWGYWKSEQSAMVLHTAKQVMQQLKWKDLADLVKDRQQTPPPASVTHQEGVDPCLFVVDPIDGTKQNLLTLAQNVTLPQEDKTEEISRKEADKAELSATRGDVAQCSSITLPKTQETKPSLPQDEKVRIVYEGIAELEQRHDGSAPRGGVVKYARERGVPEAFTVEFIRRELERGHLVEEKPGWIRRTVR